jgi:hypothetical protein
MNVKFEILGFGITQKISLLPHQGGGELLLFSWFMGDQSAMTNSFEL